MSKPTGKARRVFKTAWFAKAARKASIKDDELCRAIKQVVDGQVDDLGGGVYKKRLNKNMHRSIILAEGKQFWMYEYLFAKKDRDNIAEDELADFRLLAKGYASISDAHLNQLLTDGDITEICHASEAPI